MCFCEKRALACIGTFHAHTARTDNNNNNNNKKAIVISTHIDTKHKFTSSAVFHTCECGDESVKFGLGGKLQKHIVLLQGLALLFRTLLVCRQNLSRIHQTCVCERDNQYVCK